MQTLIRNTGVHDSLTDEEDVNITMNTVSRGLPKS